MGGVQTLYGEYKARGKDMRFCLEGCQVPFNGTADPFVEFTEYGFRGFPSGAALLPLSLLLGVCCWEGGGNNGVSGTAGKEGVAHAGWVP